MKSSKRKHSTKRHSKHEVRVSSQPAGSKMEVRKNADGTRTAFGYFATYGTISRDIGFREVLTKGCFDESLRSNPVACYRDHNDQMLLGKTQSGTLRAWSDDRGVAFECTLPDTTYANDLIALMERGDAFENSFGFSIPDEPGAQEWAQLPTTGEPLRRINKAILYEGSILTGSPAAYPNTVADLRSVPAEFKEKLQERGFFDDGDDDDDNECPDGQVYDEELDDCVDEDSDEDRDTSDGGVETCSQCGQILRSESEQEEYQAALKLLLARL